MATQDSTTAGLRQYLNFVNIPKPDDLVYKEEDAYSFDSPESEDGLFISLTSFIAFNKTNALLNFKKTKQPLYLNYKRRLRPKTTPERTEEEPPKKKPTLLGIGVEGGFQTEEKEYDEEYSLVLLPDFVHYVISTELPEKIYMSVIGIQNAREAFKQEDQTAWVAGGPLIVSQHAQNLKQLDNGVKIPPSGWKCSQCDKTDNLWLNLTDGTVLCGRRYFDGSGGNNHAVEYYQKTGYPLAVKLGTITPHGADVYSYVEDDMVEDPKLKEHLAHWGINVYEMEKTEKTMAELEVDLNFSWDWMKIQEKGKALTPLRGPGFTPIKNLGNTCYMNSILQALFSRQEFRERYAHSAKQIFEEIQDNPCASFPVQMAKMGDALVSGRYSDRDEGVGPRTLKTVIGKGHPEFSTMRQQDALEFFQYLITLIQRDEHLRKGLAISPLFTFKVEEKLQCLGSQKVKYSYRDDNALLLSIPINRALNKDEVDSKLQEIEKLGNEGVKIEKPRYKVPFAFCLETFVEPEEISNFHSSATGTTTTAIKSSKFASFPRYLVIAMRRFIRGNDWVPKKLDALVVDVPDELNLESYRGTGVQPGEEILPNDDSHKPTTPKADDAIVRSLSEMGFSETRSRKAAIKTNNTGAEAAMNWLLEHMDDPDIDDPLEASPIETESINEEGIAILVSMGFTVNQAKKALKATGNNIERATDWIFSHTDELDDDSSTQVVESKKESELGFDTSAIGRYKLFGLVSHIGASTHSGHYVCHLRSEEDGKWGLFNDEQLSVSEDPPKEMAYLYLYQRV